MHRPIDDLQGLMEAGKFIEAKALLEAEKVRAKFAPDTITELKGKGIRATKKGKPVEEGVDGARAVNSATVSGGIQGV